KYARRQWSLVDRDDLQYRLLNAFDNAMIGMVDKVRDFQKKPIEKLWEKDDDQVLAFRRGNLVFVFNFNPFKSFSGYGILAPAGSYTVELSSDNTAFGGFGNIDETVRHLTVHDPLYAPVVKEWLKLYLPARSAQVLRLHRSRKK
ncbi:MAG: alpha amylase C-terminal domain-containing protein, partial [Muribaculaceae bacterium]|nr:alpha amylase C-terminal domain-containing protein [Muribaculaceae bacterium]